MISAMKYLFIQISLGTQLRYNNSLSEYEIMSQLDFKIQKSVGSIYNTKILNHILLNTRRHNG